MFRSDIRSNMILMISRDSFQSFNEMNLPIIEKFPTAKRVCSAQLSKIKKEGRLALIFLDLVHKCYQIFFTHAGGETATRIQDVESGLDDLSRIFPYLLGRTL